MNRNNNQVIKMLALISQLGITVLTTIFLCMGLGFVVEKYLGFDIMIWCIILGVLAAFKSAYMLIKRYIGSDDDKT